MNKINPLIDFEPDPKKMHDRFMSMCAEKLLRDQQPRRFLQDAFIREVGFELPSRQVLVLKAIILDLVHSTNNELPGPHNHHNYIQYVDLLDAVQLTIMNGINNGDFSAWPCFIDGEMFFLVSLQHPINKNNVAACAKVLEQLHQLCIYAVERIQNEYEIIVQIRGSSLVLDVEKLYSNFEILKSGELDDIPGDPVMFLPEKTPFLLAPTGKLNATMMKLEQHVINSAIAHKWETTYKTFIQLINIELSFFPAKYHIRERAIDRMCSIFAVTGIPFYTKKCPQLRVHVWRRDIKYAITESDVKDIIHELLNTCSEYFHPLEVPIVNRIDEIASFINENFKDPNLCANVICERFGISISYLSHIFKERKGVKLINYIHMKRIAASKPLLLSSPILPIDQVAKQVGYASALTYTRAFKRIDGLTPGAYRKTLGETDRVEQADGIKRL